MIFQTPIIDCDVSIVSVIDVSDDAILLVLLAMLSLSTWMDEFEKGI